MPENPGELASVENVRNWQVKWYGDEVLEIIQRYRPKKK